MCDQRSDAQQHVASLLPCSVAPPVGTYLLPVESFPRAQAQASQVTPRGRHPSRLHACPQAAAAVRRVERSLLPERIADRRRLWRWDGLRLGRGNGQGDRMSERRQQLDPERSLVPGWRMGGLGILRPSGVSERGGDRSEGRRRGRPRPVSPARSTRQPRRRISAGRKRPRLPCKPPNPPAWTGACYHRAGCRSLSRSGIPLTREEAEGRGLRPCSICQP